MKKKTSSRRDFLQKAALAPLATGLLSCVVDAESKEKASANEEDVECFKTTLDYYGQGPFYTPNAPAIASNQLAPANEPGTRLLLSGVVRTLDCSEVIPNALLDIWHADHEGAYDNAGYHLRGKTTSNDQGFYLFETILPGKYLNGSSYRPSHIHYKITPPGFPTLITQLYFEGDTDIPGDAAASITSGQYDASHRIIQLTENSQGIMEGTWDIVVDGDGVTGANDIHLETGILYSVAPNPFSDSLEINYGVFQRAKVRIEIFDRKGALVATLVNREMEPQKYKAVWNEGSSVPAGHYWVTIKINELQVHYLKVLKM